MEKFERLKHGTRAKDLTGFKFGALTVIGFSHRKVVKKGTKLFWYCQCECSAVRQVMSYHLTNNEVASCGMCSISRINKSNNSHTKLPFGEANFRRIYQGYIGNAKTKGRAFEISMEEFRVLVAADCHYCGRPPVARQVKRKHVGLCKANGLDRTDSNKPYTLDNVVTCCSYCNTMKLDMTYSEFVEHIKRIHTHLQLGSL